MSSSTKMCGLMMVVVVVVGMAAVEAQTGNIPPCASKLLPCADYLNSTNPPASCCNPLREAITNELSCLCSLYNEPGLLPAFGINITQALLLPARCNINANLNSCNAANAPGPSSVPPPPAVPGGGDGNGVGKISWSGISSVLLILASMMLYS